MGLVNSADHTGAERDAPVQMAALRLCFSAPETCSRHPEGMVRRLLTWSVWGLTTAVATTVSWAGVSVVTASITAAHSPAIPAKEIHADLAAPVPAEGREPSGLVVEGVAPSSPAERTAQTPAPRAAPTAVGSPTVLVAPAVVGASPRASAAAPPPDAFASSQGSDTPRPTSLVAVGPPVPPSATPAPVVASSPPRAPPTGSGSGSDAGAGGGGSPSSSSSPPTSSPPSQPTGSSGISTPLAATFSTSGGTVTVSCQGSTISLVSASPADGYALVVRSSGPGFVDVDFTGQPNGSSVRATCMNGAPVRVIDE